MRPKVIIPTALKLSPLQDEVAVAEALANFLQHNVYFVDRGVSRTPDLYVPISRQYWEIKNIRGNSSRTIANALRSAQYQSNNVIISLSRTNLSLAQATGRVHQYLKAGPTRLKRILILSKKQKVIVLK